MRGAPGGSAAHLLPPATLGALGDFRLAARAVVDGFVAGVHHSRRPGTGGDFLQYRAFQAGDDPRRLDWRAFARSDRLYVRETEVEREVRVRILLDATASMAHADRTLDPPLAKIDYARLCAAALVWLADRQGDRCTLAVIDGAGADQLVGRPGGRRTVDRLLDRLAAVTPRGAWPAPERLGALEAPGRRRDKQLIVALSDLHPAEANRGAEPAPDPIATFSRLATQGHEVLVLHLLGRDELEFAYRGDLLFEDLESRRTVRGNADELRPRYLELLEADLAGRRQRLQAAGVEYQLIRLDEPLELALRRALMSRQAVG